MIKLLLSALALLGWLTAASMADAAVVTIQFQSTQTYRNNVQSDDVLGLTLSFDTTEAPYQTTSNSSADFAWYRGSGPATLTLNDASENFGPDTYFKYVADLNASQPNGDVFAVETYQPVYSGGFELYDSLGNPSAIDSTALPSSALADHTTLSIYRDNAAFIALGRITFSIASVPEPATWAMMLAGFGMIGGAMRRRKANVSYA